MLEETRKWYCDICGKEITEQYQGVVPVIEVDEDGYAHSEGLDFCLECMLSFRKWREGRREKSKDAE